MFTSEFIDRDTIGHRVLSTETLSAVFSLKDIGSREIVAGKSAIQIVQLSELRAPKLNRDDERYQAVAEQLRQAYAADFVETYGEYWRKKTSAKVSWDTFDRLFMYPDVK